jgi:hypothetical protein
VPRETPDHGLECCQSLSRRPSSRPDISGSGAEGGLPPPSPEALLPTANLVILEPRRLADRVISSRLYCTSKVLWKLNWFLRDFGYDSELLGRDEVDERQLVGLKGIVKISHIVFNGASLLRFDGFAPAGHWEELSPSNLDSPQVA